MSKYHYNSETGRANICRASEGKCPLGGNTPHFDSKEEAKEYIAKTAKENNNLFTPLMKESSSKNNKNIAKDSFKPSFKNVKSKEETLKMIRNWKTGEYTRKQLDQMNLEEIEVDTSYGRNNATISLSNDDNHAFLYGSCLAWAYEAHLQHGGDFVIWTITKEDESWEGHAALDLGNGEYFDCEGTDLYEEGDSNFMGIPAKCAKISPEEFIKKFKMDEVSKDYNNIGRYMLGYKVNDFLKEEGLLK